MSTNGRTAGLLYPQANANAVNAFLEQLAKGIDGAVHVALIRDQAGYHTSDKLNVPANISLIQLPPRSPELSPIENLWHYLRQHDWSNRACEDSDALFDAALDAWQNVCLNRETVRSVCRISCPAGQN